MSRAIGVGVGVVCRLDGRVVYLAEFAFRASPRQPRSMVSVTAVPTESHGSRRQYEEYGTTTFHFPWPGTKTNPPRGSALEGHNWKLLSLSGNFRRPQRHSGGLYNLNSPNLDHGNRIKTKQKFPQQKKRTNSSLARPDRDRCGPQVPREQTNSSQFSQRCQSYSDIPHPPFQLPKRPQPARPSPEIYPRLRLHHPMSCIIIGHHVYPHRSSLTLNTPPPHN